MQLFSVVENKFVFLSTELLPGFWLAITLLCLLIFLLSLGRRLEPALKLERVGIPIALLLGTLALFLGPYGPVSLFPQKVTDIWVKLPTPLLTLVFATLMLGRPLPRGKGLWKPVASQAALGFFLGFGQYLVGGLAVIFLLIPWLGVDPLMGCLIEVGFEGGHGAAAVMGKSFIKLGFSGGPDLGFAMATVGLLSSTIIGSALVVIGRSLGWIGVQTIQGTGITGAREEQIDFFGQIKELAINLFFVGLAVGIGVFALYILRLMSPYFGGIYSEVIEVFPVFPLALLASLIIRFLLELLNKTDLVSQLLQREIGTLSTDLLIVTAMASLNLPLIKNDWVPILILSIVGLSWNLFGSLVYSKYIFTQESFERALAEFGNATGVAASGILLLRLADPRNTTNTLQVFSIKQLFLQPLLSGGVITLFAPIAINRFGLVSWTEVSGLFAFFFIALSFFFSRMSPREI
ncbi:sodium:solute symporter [Prochlorococcus sp. MIT 1300]|uniref:sodium/glutamate symporter n=1 Tax=Prochlorococcus sp. MIT 1300 TaxID=3096218 RepID=UPI002A7512E4|nr:sodium:solute symporter [Prochlorococcus sp. MIT 1300]